MTTLEDLTLGFNAALGAAAIGVRSQEAEECFRHGLALALALQGSATLERCAAWCESQAASDWYGRTAADMVRAFAATPPKGESTTPAEPITRIRIPTETMEQEFQTHYRRGFEAGRRATPTAAAPTPAGKGLLYCRQHRQTHHMDCHECRSYLDARLAYAATLPPSPQQEERKALVEANSYDAHELADILDAIRLIESDTVDGRKQIQATSFRVLSEAASALRRLASLTPPAAQAKDSKQ